MVRPAGAAEGPSQGQEGDRTGQSRARGLLAPPRTLWDSGKDAGGPMLDQEGRLGRDREAAIRTPSFAGGIWSSPARRGNEGAEREPPWKTHFLAQVKEHPGSPEMTTPAV